MKRDDGARVRVRVSSEKKAAARQRPETRDRITLIGEFSNIAASEALPRSRRGEAHRRQGWVGGVYPPHRFKARTAASDGQRAYPRAARSAGLRFAVILLSKTMDVGWDHLIHRKRSPFPYEGKALTPAKVGETFPAGRGTSTIAASGALPRSRRGEAHRRRGNGCRPPCGAVSEGFRVERNPSD